MRALYLFFLGMLFISPVFGQGRPPWLDAYLACDRAMTKADPFQFPGLPPWTYPGTYQQQAGAWMVVKGRTYFLPVGELFRRDWSWAEMKPILRVIVYQAETPFGVFSIAPGTTSWRVRTELADLEMPFATVVRKLEPLVDEELRFALEDEIWRKISVEEQRFPLNTSSSQDDRETCEQSNRQVVSALKYCRMRIGRLRERNPETLSLIDSKLKLFDVPLPRVGDYDGPKPTRLSL